MKQGVNPVVAGIVIVLVIGIALVAFLKFGSGPSFGDSPRPKGPPPPVAGQGGKNLPPPPFAK